jgi:hypothetical protein|tara:strand:- start:104 stop:1330 length:1227 start_codon:yes stop_codon:yes gene_type:complete
MANSDAIIANGTGQTVRTDIESNLQALKSNNSTGTTPTGNNLTSYMSWANTSSNQYQVHNSTAFLPVIDISTGSSAGTHISKPGTSAIPGYRFLNSSGSAVQSGMGLPADTRLGFFISGSEKVSVLSDGKVGIGNTGPSEMLEVNGGGAIIKNTTNDAYLQIEASNSNNNDEAYLDLATYAHSDYAARFIRHTGGTNAKSAIEHRGTGELEINAYDAGEVHLMTSNASRYKVTASGAFVWSSHTGSLGSTDASGVIVPRGIMSKTGSNAGATTLGNVYNFYWNSSNQLKCWIDETDVGQVSGPSSDYRIKQNITTQTESGIDKIKQLRPVTYQYQNYSVFKADGVTREGFIAHEIQEVIPSGADGVKDGDSIQSLNVDAIISVLTKALQEAVAKIETLETKVAALEAS